MYVEHLYYQCSTYLITLKYKILSKRWTRFKKYYSDPSPRHWSQLIFRGQSWAGALKFYITVTTPEDLLDVVKDTIWMFGALHQRASKFEVTEMKKCNFINAPKPTQ